jgi:hypothetical protein
MRLISADYLNYLRRIGSFLAGTAVFVVGGFVAAYFESRFWGLFFFLCTLLALVFTAGVMAVGFLDLVKKRRAERGRGSSTAI